MNIGILGAGNVGVALGTALARAGHSVRYGMRTPTKRPDDGLTFAVAVDFADMVVVSLPYGAIEEVLGALQLEGRALIDTTNPMGWEEGSPVHTPPDAGSAAEQIAALTGARVVKGFNTFGAEHCAGGTLEGRPIDVMLASDDSDALEVATGLCGDLGLRPIHVGPLRQARATEQLAVLWVQLAVVGEQGRNIAFSLLRGD